MAEFAINLNAGKTDEKGMFRLLGKLFNQSGVVEATAMTVAAQASPDMTVRITGSAASDNAVFLTTNADCYHGWNTASYNVTIAANASGVTKKDTVIAYIDTAAGSATANNPAGLKFVAVRGSGTDTAPTDGEVNTAISSKPFIRLANVQVANGAASINSGNLTDVRPRAVVKPLTITQSASFTYALNAAQVTSFTSVLVAGSAGNGTYNIQGIVDLSALALPAAATIINHEIWVHMAGNTTSQGYARCAVLSLSSTSATFRVQAAGNDSGTFPNLTNSKIEGYVRYIP